MFLGAKIARDYDLANNPSSFPGSRQATLDLTVDPAKRLMLLTL